jgi:uncharacterized protein (TIGR02246 family)
MSLWRRCVVAATLILLPTAPPRLAAQKRTPKPSQAAAATNEQDREGVAALQRNTIAASMAFDINAILGLWTDDAVILPPRHEPITGKPALHKYLEEKKEQYANYDMLAYNEQWNEVMVIGEYAYQCGTISIRAKPPTGPEVEKTVHAMRILKREDDGAWRVSRAIWNEAGQ